MAVKLDKNRTNAFAKSFIPMSFRDWNSFPATVFPATYNLQLFKTPVSTDNFDFYTSHKNSSCSSFHDEGANQSKALGGATSWWKSFLH